VHSLLKAPPGTTLPTHHHTGAVIAYTIKRNWRHLEHDWIARPANDILAKVMRANRNLSSKQNEALH
jgi:hypothetical protein